MQHPIDVTPVKPLFHNTAGHHFDPDIRPGLVRCRDCFALLAPEQADAHQCDGLLLMLAAVLRASEVVS